MSRTKNKSNYKKNSQYAPIFFPQGGSIIFIARTELSLFNSMIPKSHICAYIHSTYTLSTLWLCKLKQFERRKMEKSYHEITWMHQRANYNVEALRIINSIYFIMLATFIPKHFSPYLCDEQNKNVFFFKTNLYHCICFLNS